MKSFRLLLATGLLLVPFQAIQATTPPPPDPVYSTIKVTDPIDPYSTYLTAKRAIQEGAAVVPYLVAPGTADPLPSFLAPITSFPLAMYGPSILVTKPVLLQPLGSSGSNYGNTEWETLVPGSIDRVVALNGINGTDSSGSNTYGHDLISGNYYQAEAGWVDSAVVGWIYSFGYFPNGDFSYGGWYYLPGRGSVYIVDRSVDGSNTNGCNTYYVYDPARESWYYLNSDSPEYLYNFTQWFWDTVEPKHPTPASGYVGLTETAAYALAASTERPARTVMIDGIALPVTADYFPVRLNFTVESGIVVAVTLG